MALLSDTFTDLCVKHDLCSIDVGIMMHDDKRISYVTYAQWYNVAGERGGVQKIADTPEAAITGAITDMIAKRFPAPSIEALEVAA